MSQLIKGLHHVNLRTNGEARFRKTVDFYVNLYFVTNSI